MHRTFSAVFWILFLGACSVTGREWVQKSEGQKTVLVGPILESSAAISKLSGLLQQSIYELAKQPLQSDLPQHDLSIKIVAVDWFARYDELPQIWNAMEKLAGTNRGHLDGFELFEILKSFDLSMYDRLLLVRFRKSKLVRDRYILDGYRLLKAKSDEISANRFSIPLSISGPSQELKKQLSKYIARLVESAEYMTPDFSPLGFVHIVGGCFVSEAGKEKECVDGFKLARYPVTHSQWRFVMNVMSRSDGRREEFPAVNMDWNEIQHFIEKLNDLTGRSYRLPTEVEWEYACKNMGKIDDNPYPQPISPQFANYAVTGRWRGLSVLGKYPPAPIGLHDMVGNVWEWTQSRYSENRDSVFFRFLRELDIPKRYIVKGGSFDSRATETNCNSRNGVLATTGAADIGFRLVLDE